MQDSKLPKKVKTKNILQSIQKFAQNSNISIKECDFTINHIDTYMNFRAIDDYQLYNEDIHQFYDNKEKMLNEHVNLNQIYTITIKKTSKCIIKLDYSIEFDKYRISPRLIISPKSHIPYQSYKSSEILLLLVKEINKIKAKNKILVKIFDECLIKSLKAFVKYIYLNKFSKKIKITLFEGITPTISRQSKLIYWYKEKSLDYQVIEVQQNEVIVEYKKAIFGKNGFNSFGKYINSGSVFNNDDFSADIDDESIEVSENDDKKLYKSKVKGFVHFENNLLSIDNKVKIKKLSRVHNSVTEEEDNNIEVLVAQHDTNQDSIGEGVELQSEIINITGHVGANSKLEALSLKIDGATHKSSIQHAKDAVINRHKGTLHCNNAKIKLLEGGVIHASNVDVDAALGGLIYAENVTVNIVKSHLKIYASNSITINLVTGEDNIFKINYKDVPVILTKLDYLDKDIDELKYTLEGALKHSPLDVESIKQKIKDKKSQKTNIFKNVIKAKISIKKAFKGLNTIIFTLDSDDEIIFKTDPLLYEPFYIELSQDKLTLQPVNKSIKLS